MTNLPTTPESARAEQKRVLGLLESIEQDRTALFAATEKHHADPRPLKTSVSSEQYAAQKSLIAQEVHLRTMAPDLAQAYADLLGQYASLLAERERVQRAAQGVLYRADECGLLTSLRTDLQGALLHLQAALAAAPAEAEGGERWRESVMPKS